MRSNSSAASFRPSATCSAVILDLSKSLPLAAFSLPSRGYADCGQQALRSRYVHAQNVRKCGSVGKRTHHE